jgi:hypothetical protein
MPKLLSLLPEFEQINGIRNVEYGSLKFLRVFIKWLLKIFASYISGQKIPDLNTGFKVFKRDTMLKYLWAIPDGFSCTTSMTLVYLCNGYKVG